MPCRKNIVSYRRHYDSWQFAECPCVARCDGAAPGQVRLKFFELRETGRAGDVRQAIVKSQQDHFKKPLASLLALPRIAADSMIAKPPQGFRQLRVTGRNHAAFAGGEMFHGMKAEYS